MMGAMAEPRRRLPREQRRRTLLDAGRAIILEGGGYGELTMERVARAAGVSKTLVYDHFAHRRELYLALLAEERVRLVQRLAPPLSHGDRETRVRETVSAALELMAEYGDGYAEMFRNPLAHDPGLTVELLRGRDELAELIAGVIAADFEVPMDRVRLAGQSIVGAMEAAMEWIARAPVAERPPSSEIAELMTRLIWSGLGGIEGLVGAGSDPEAAVVELRRG
jgi:AcrR family transcriptional regulator